MSLSLQVLDFYDDVGSRQLASVASSAPGFIKSAKVADRNEVANLPVENFAVHILTKEGSRLKKYPTHSQADTWLSCAYFEKNAYKMPKTAAKIAAGNLKIACERHGIETPAGVVAYCPQENPNTNLYVEDMDSMRKTASHNPIHEESGADFALNGRYPLFNEGFVKKAADYFTDYFGQFSARDRHVFASNLEKRASALGVTLNGDATAMIRKVAGDGYGDKLDTQIRLRMNMVDGFDNATRDLAKVASARSLVEPSKFAELLSAWDSEYGISEGSHILDAYQATFSKIEKTAGFIYEDDGMTLTNKELEKAADEKYDKIKGYFGETLAGSLKKHGSVIFDSLPIDAKSVIVKIAKGNL